MVGGHAKDRTVEQHPQVCCLLEYDAEKWVDGHRRFGQTCCFHLGAIKLKTQQVWCLDCKKWDLQCVCSQSKDVHNLQVEAVLLPKAGARRHIQEDGNIHRHLLQNFSSHRPQHFLLDADNTSSFWGDVVEFRAELAGQWHPFPFWFN